MSNPRNRKKPPSKGRTAPAAYDVGYGKPPKSTRFKKGQVANPKGRRPKVKFGPAYARQLARNAFERKRKVTLNGVEKVMTNMEIGIEFYISKPSSTLARDLQRTIEIIEWAYSDVQASESRDNEYAADAALVRARLQAIADRRQAAREARADEQPPSHAASNPKADDSL